MELRNYQKNAINLVLGGYKKEGGGYYRQLTVLPTLAICNLN